MPPPLEVTTLQTVPEIRALSHASDFCCAADVWSYPGDVLSCTRFPTSLHMSNGWCLQSARDGEASEMVLLLSALLHVLLDQLHGF